MTGILNVLVATAGGSGVVSPAIVLSDVHAGSMASATILFYANGTIVVGGSGSSATPPNWYLPATAGIGAGYWRKLVVNSGTPPSANVGNIVAMNTDGDGWFWSLSGVGTQASNVTVTIYSNAGGTNVAGSFTFNVNLTRT